MSHFFESYLLQQFCKLKSLGEHDFLKNPQNAESLGELKDQIVKIGNETTQVLKNFAKFCEKSLAQVVGPGQVPSFLEILLDIVVSRGQARQRYALRAPKKLGQGMFPQSNMYMSYFDAKNSAVRGLNPNSVQSLGNLSKSTSSLAQAKPAGLTKPTVFPSFSKSLEFLIAARVLSNIDESTGIADSAQLQSKLLGHFFSFSGSVLYRLFQAICREGENHDYLSSLDKGHREFLFDFFARNEKALTQREERAVLVLFNFVNSAVFCVNQLSVVGQTKQSVRKMGLLEAHQSVSETDMLIARETLVFESSPNTVIIFFLRLFFL